jgi:Spy/CpxP family protein refolding chaperone
MQIKCLSAVAVVAAAALFSGLAGAQPADHSTASDPGSSLVTRMMVFDKNHDGKLTKEEVTDERLHRLFDRADANSDGVVTREELVVLAEKFEAEAPQGGGPDGPGGPGGPGGGPRGGPGQDGRQGPGGGDNGFHLVPRFIERQLNLSEDQQQQIAQLEKETKAKLERILKPDQLKMLEQSRPGMRQGGPGGGQGRPGDGGRQRPGGPQDRQ